MYLIHAGNFGCKVSSSGWVDKASWVPAAAGASGGWGYTGRVGYPYYNSWTGVCVFVALLLQFWTDHIQTCCIGSAWPQLVYRDVFIFAVYCVVLLQVGEGVTSLDHLQYIQYSCPHFFQYSEVMFLLHGCNLSYLFIYCCQYTAQIKVCISRTCCMQLRTWSHMGQVLCSSL